VTTRSSDTQWIKATSSGLSGNCVELRRRAGAVEIRDSKDPHGPVLRFASEEFTALLDGARRAEFDHLARG
jgi:hypothetical protein